MELDFSFNDKKINIESGIIVTIQASDINSFVEKISLKDGIVIDYDSELLGFNFLDGTDIYEKDLLDKLLSIFKLNVDILNKPFSNLSFTEKIFLNIIKALLKQSNIVFFVDIYKYLDYNSEKKIKELLLYLKSKKYYIFISSSDVNNLYNLGDYSLILWKKFIKYGKTSDIYTDVDKLISLGADIPTLSYITYKAKIDKNVKLFYSKDVRDIIKDIYKHV